MTIPNSVTNIGYSAFRGCQRLKSIKIPNSVRYIHDRTFEFCLGLTSITIPNSVTGIGKNAFNTESTHDLDTVYIPSSVTYISDECAFKYGTRFYVENGTNTLLVLWNADSSFTAYDAKTKQLLNRPEITTVNHTPTSLSIKVAYKRFVSILA